MKDEIKRHAQAGYWSECGALVLLTLLAAGLRFYKLGEWSLFFDELRTWENALHLYSQPLMTLFYPGHSQVFWLITKLSLDTFGPDTVSLRFFPSVFGIATIPLLYFPLRKIFDRRIGFITVFLLAISPWHIYMSQMARWYTILVLLVFLSLLSFYLFMETNKITYLFFYTILFCIAFSLHLSAGFIPIVTLTYILSLLVLGRFRSENLTKKKLLIILAAHMVLFFGLLPQFVNFIIAWKSSERVFGVWGQDFILKFLYHITPSIGCISLVGAIILLKRNDRRGLLLTFYCLVPILALILGLLFRMNISVRYLLFTLPAVMLMAGYFYMYIYDQLYTNRILLIFALILATVSPSLYGVFLYFTSEYGYRDRMREALQYVQENAHDNDQFFIPAIIYGSREFEFYYRVVENTRGIDINEKGLIISSSLERLDLLNRIWVMTYAKPQRNSQGKWQWIAENTHLKAEFGARRANQDQTIKVYLYSP